MHLGQPEFMILLSLVVALIGFFIWAGKRKRALAAGFVDRTLLFRLIPANHWEKERKRTVLLVLSVLFLILALTQPRWGYRWEDLKQHGVDIVVAVDVSNSMLATDIKPSRLARAKHKVADLLNLLQGDRIGLVAFAGTSFLQCPLTLDYNAAAMFLDALDTDLIPLQGTALGPALHTAIEAFSDREKKSKAIILITDGEDHQGDTLKAAKEARQRGIKIFVIGIGQEEGAPIPDTQRGHGFKQDASGDVVLSRLNETVLQQVAIQTGGSYVSSVQGDLDLQKIYLEDIKQMVEKKELRSTRRKRWQERFQWLVALGLMCLVGERLIREK